MNDSWNAFEPRIREAITHQAKTLDLSGLSLAEVPPAVAELTYLQTLYLDDNNLFELPDFIGNLTQLQYLSLQNNRLSMLPESLGCLTELTHLNLSSNNLTGLPGFVGRLTRLRELDLRDNRLVQLPQSLKSLDSLEKLYLSGNSGLGLPPEMVQDWRMQELSKPRVILEFYFRVGQGHRPLNEAKLILVGRGGVGKTSVVNRLVRDKFEPFERKTEGIQITKLMLRLKKNGQEDEEVRLNVWDFGGQEIMHATHQFFLTQRSLYLLVLNGREGFEEADADYWLKLIESFGGDSPVIVVLNKIREHPFDVNHRALQQKYPAIRDFIKTDCAHRIGIRALKEAVERETAQLKHLRDPFPASWSVIKDNLAGMEKNYLSFKEYREFCAGHGETERDAQEALASYLHTLGIILNYKDDPRLEETHVLNPHWVTSGIYEILNSSLLEKQRGEIHLHQLSQILDEEAYPPHMRRFILDLMKRFELCFSFPEDECHYLIPELLDKQEPPDAGRFTPGECLNFQYHYPILPEGLLPRFIVRTHVLSEREPRWRTGVILRFEGNRALVKADVQDKRVFIRVAGPADSSRRLLAVIRSDFERIHRDIRNLNPQEMVPLPGKPEALVPYEKLLVFERDGIEKFPESAAGKTFVLDVQELLNGVDLDGSRRRVRALDERVSGVRLFVSYSRRDESFRKELETHLKILQQRGLVDVWSDRDIEAGDDWRQRIDDNLERADIILLLVSADFNASDYCREKEMKRALEREKNGDAVVVPVVVRDADLSEAPFAYLQYLPEGGKAVALWGRRKDSAWRSVSEGIEKVAKQVRTKVGRI